MIIFPLIFSSVIYNVIFTRSPHASLILQFKAKKFYKNFNPDLLGSERYVDWPLFSCVYGFQVCRCYPKTYYNVQCLWYLKKIHLGTSLMDANFAKTRVSAGADHCGRHRPS